MFKAIKEFFFGKPVEAQKEECPYKVEVASAAPKVEEAPAPVVETVAVETVAVVEKPAKPKKKPSGKKPTGEKKQGSPRPRGRKPKSQA